MKLATFETIDLIEPIEGKDKIVKLTIKGFELVSLKDKFKVGDICVLVAPDTLIDRKLPWFKDFRSDRVKTEKIGGVYSQGIALSLDELEQFNLAETVTHLTEEEIENTDLGSLIGVKKYEKDIAQRTKGKDTNIPLPGFPLHLIPITDEENLKSIKGKYKNILFGEELLDKVVDVTQKLDGTSITLIWYFKKENNQNVFMMASRNHTLHKETLGYRSDDWNLEFSFPDDKTTYIKEHNIRDLFFGRNIAIQGELCGPKIGGNKMKLPKHMFFVFNVRDLDTGDYYSYAEIKKLCSESGLEPVPLIRSLTISPETDLAFFQNLADEQKYGEHEGEGIVVRPQIPFASKALGGKNCSFKLINRKYKD